MNLPFEMLFFPIYLWRHRSGAILLRTRKSVGTDSDTGRFSESKTGEVRIRRRLSEVSILAWDTSRTTMQIRGRQNGSMPKTE